MKKLHTYLWALIAAILVSWFDATIVMPNKFAPLWQVTIIFPGNFCAWLVNLAFSQQLVVTSSQREFGLTLPFNFVWFSAWAYIVKTIVEDLRPEQKAKISN